MIADLHYRNNGLFTSFLPNTKAGETAWCEIASKNDGVGNVLTIHAASTIKQLRGAGYTVNKAPTIAVDDADLLAALEL